MFPAEMLILMAIALAGDSVSKIVDRPMDVSGEYIYYLYESLVKRGYLSCNDFNEYSLTLKGKKAICEFLRKNKEKLHDMVRMLRIMGVETDSRVAEIERIYMQ